MSHTWRIGDTTFVGNGDLSGDIEIRRLFPNATSLAIMVPGRDLVTFIRDRFAEVINDEFCLGEPPAGKSPR